MAPHPTLEGILLSESEALSDPLSIPVPETVSSPLVTFEAHDVLRRATITNKTQNTAPVNPNFDGGAGSKPASDFNNQGFLALFATIGAVMVVVAIWFFFWAKNGGFHFQEGDWDDYKSTVLRRKGPDGRTLTNATKSTKLGGSTIVGTQHFKWARQQAKSVVSYDRRGRKGVLGQRGWGKTHSITYSDNFTEWGDNKTTTDEMAEVRAMPEPQHRPSGYRDRDVQDYKREKPARVGGLNRIPDGSGLGGTTNTDGSDLYSDSDRGVSKKERSDSDKDRAERRARAEAAKMERRWKKEAEEAAAALARESARSISQPAKSTPPSKQRSASRSASPKKRDFSYQAGPETELLSTINSSGGGTPSKRTSSSYYDAYRPSGAGNDTRHASGGRRQSSPTKKSGARGGGGYRRGADSDLD